MTQVCPVVAWHAQLCCCRFRPGRHQDRRSMRPIVTGHTASLLQAAVSVAGSSGHPRSTLSARPVWAWHAAGAKPVSRQATCRGYDPRYRKEHQCATALPVRSVMA
jgi:hypothetical protein